MPTNRRRFLSLLALGIPVGVSATKRSSVSSSLGNELCVNEPQRDPVRTVPARVLIVEDSENERAGLAIYST